MLPDLLDTMNSVLPRSSVASIALICAGTVESRMRNRGKPGLWPNVVGQHLGAEARAAHAEQERILKSLAPDLLGKGLIALDLIGVDAVEPAEPAILVGAGPQRFVALPKTADIAVACATPRRRSRPLLGQASSPSDSVLPVDLAAEHCAAFFRHSGEQLVGRVGEQPHALFDQLVGHGVERNSGAAEIVRARAARRRRCLRGCRALCRGRGTRPWSRSAWC